MRATCLTAFAALLPWLGGGSLSEAAEETLPRYNLPLGRKLVYTASGESKPTQPGGSEMHTSGSWELTAVGENPDGSKRLILRSASKSLKAK